MGDIRGMRIGVPKRYLHDKLNSLVEEYFNRALKALENLGAIVIDIDLPIADDPRDIAHVIATSEVGYEHRDLIQSSLSQYSEGARQTFEKSKMITAHAYLEGLNKRAQWDQEISSLFEGIDIFVTPTIPVPPTEIDVIEIELGGERESVNESLIRFTSLFNVTGHPALSIPCGLSDGSIPIGLQFIANHFREDLLIKTAYSYEQAYLSDFYDKRIDRIRSLKQKALI